MTSPKGTAMTDTIFPIAIRLADARTTKTKIITDPKDLPLHTNFQIVGTNVALDEQSREQLFYKNSWEATQRQDMDAFIDAVALGINSPDGTVPLNALDRIRPMFESIHAQSEATYRMWFYHFCKSVLKLDMDDWTWLEERL